MLEAEGIFINKKNSLPVKLQYIANLNGGNYVELKGQQRSISREKLISLATRGEFIGTFTGKHGQNFTS